MCFPSMRSLPGQLHLGPREQINQNTAFVDGSMVRIIAIFSRIMI